MGRARALGGFTSSPRAALSLLSWNPAQPGDLPNQLVPPTLYALAEDHPAPQLCLVDAQLQSPCRFVSCLMDLEKMETAGVQDAEKELKALGVSELT